MTDANPLFIPLPPPLDRPAAADATTAATAATAATTAAAAAAKATSWMTSNRPSTSAERIGAHAASEAAARPCPFLGWADAPCAQLGLWRAYAGSGAARHAARGAPRHVVLETVEALLSRHPSARVVVCGHSLGGCLASLCAHDLLCSCAAARAAGVTLVSFAAPRFFNKGFQAVRAAQLRRRNQRSKPHLERSRGLCRSLPPHAACSLQLASAAHPPARNPHPRLTTAPYTLRHAGAEHDGGDGPRRARRPPRRRRRRHHPARAPPPLPLDPSTINRSADRQIRTPVRALPPPDQPTALPLPPSDQPAALPLPPPQHLPLNTLISRSHRAPPTTSETPTGAAACRRRPPRRHAAPAAAARAYRQHMVRVWSPWRRHGWPPRARQTASKGVGLAS